METTTTREELEGYVSDLRVAREKILSYQARKGESQMNHTSQDVVLITAIDGLLGTINATDPISLTLERIVNISDTVGEVLRSVNQFISRH